MIYSSRKLKDDPHKTWEILTIELAFLSSFEKIPVNIQKRSKARVINDVFTVLLMVSNNKK